MISSITFEVAALADAIKKAASVAPTKGEAFDKAAGLIISFDPADNTPLAVIQSTDLRIFSMEWVNALDRSGEAAQWRFPSVLAGIVIGSLPIGSGKTVTLHSEKTDHSYIIHLESGRVKAKFYPLDVSYYPEWGAFDPDNMSSSRDLGGRLAQVEWACGSADPRLAGIYLDGKYAVATDTIRMARVPIVIPSLKQPLVIPGGVLSSALSLTGETQVGVSENMVHIMPDEYTQIKSVIFDVKYPPVQKVIDLQFDTAVRVSRDEMVETLRRVDAFTMGERGVAVRCFFGSEELAFYMANDQVGHIGDVIEVPGYAVHDRFEFKFTPKNLLDGLSHAPNDKITLLYNHGKAQSVLKIDGGSGYECWLMPRREV